MKGARRRAREAVLRALYRAEYYPTSPAADPLGAVPVPVQEHAFAATLLSEVLEHQGDIDAIIDARAEGWGLDRLALVDRNILRLALGELLYTGTPAEVVMDEAVELAKRFGTDKAPAFINGILDRVWRDARNHEG